MFGIVSAAVDSVKNDVLYISTPSAKTSILAAADIIIEKIHIVYMSTPSARTPLVARVVFWLTAPTCIIRRTQLDARMACNVHANAARPASIEEKRIPAMLQRTGFRSDSGRCHATAQPNGEGIHGEFTPLLMGNSWEFMGIHARILY